MKISAINYSQFDRDPREWKIQNFALREINLLVGRNAVGKSKALAIINNLALLLSTPGKLPYVTGNYDVTFKHNGACVKYILVYEDKKIIHEEFSSNGKKYLERREGGTGKIFAEKENKFIDFQTPEDELAAVARRDSLQHSFFEPLYNWSKSVLFYPFSTHLGKESFAVLVKDLKIEFDLHRTDQLIPFFRQGTREFGEPFTEAIKHDMAEIGYEIEDVGVSRPTTLVLSSSMPLPGEFVGMYVKERDLNAPTEQTDISQGMFRALSILIQLNYSRMAGKQSCILIDDIGEGLDFERSCALIELLMRKASESSVQLIMSTNDRFVMNTVPIETWSVLERKGGLIKVHNYSNSKETFDKFKFTGLSNFDFLAFDFIKEGQKEG